jgi:hypothetical protein
MPPEDEVELPAEGKIELPISAEPTKEFFVDMITKDISLEQAVLDLVDNSVDAARRIKQAGATPLSGCEIVIKITNSAFSIFDNCGGFDKDTARYYAFRFGRPPGRETSPHTIGQFGIGMKRALFKFGSHFKVASAVPTEKWAVDIDVTTWQLEKEWIFPWAAFPDDSQVSEGAPGTEIQVDQLRPEVSARFGTAQFINSIQNLIRSRHRQFLEEGLSISVNTHHLTVADFNLLITARLRPGVDFIKFEDDGKKPVETRIVAGVGDSVPKAAGWYVICNGRVVLEADRSPETGWGVVEDEKDELIIPKFHNQFARFRGIVWFDSEDAARVPWNTMKTNVDRESRIWQQTYTRMVEMMRPVVDFLNKLDRDIDEHTRDASVLFRHLVQASFVNANAVTEKGPFLAPDAIDIPNPGPPMVKIQYSRSSEEVDFLKDALGVTSAKAVGERTFDLTYRKQKA